MEKPDRRLESWKEIAVFFDRDEKTVRRWEKDLGLPVHRSPGVSKGRVYAFAQELSAWSTKPSQSKDDAPPKAANLEPLKSAPEGDAADLSGIPLAPATRATFWSRLIPVGLVVVAGLGALAFNFHNWGLAFANFRNGSIAHATARQNPEVERLYLEGRYYWNERTAAGLTRAVDDFTQAIIIDPKCAKAYAGLADSYNLIPEYTAMRHDEAFPRAETAARKAIALDANLEEGHRALAFPSYWWRHDVATADREFSRAIALNPNDATARLWYANFLVNIGENEKALEQVNRAQDLDPSSSSIRADKGRLLYTAGRKDEAIALLRQMKRNEPSFVSPHRYLAQIYLMEADYPEYLLEAEEAAKLVNRPDDLKLVEAEKRGYAQGGGRGLLQAMFTAQKELYQQERLQAYDLAATSAMLGNKADAVRYLMTSRDRHEAVLLGLAADLTMRSLRDEPEYKELVAEAATPKVN